MGYERDRLRHGEKSFARKDAQGERMDRSEVGVSPHDSLDASRLVVTVHGSIYTYLPYTVVPTMSISLT